MGPRLPAYAGPSATLEDLEGLFLSLLPWTTACSCLVINSALELGSDRVAAHGVSRGLQAVTDHLDGVLLRERMTQRHRLVSHFPWK